MHLGCRRSEVENTYETTVTGFYGSSDTQLLLTDHHTRVAVRIGRAWERCKPLVYKCWNRRKPGRPHRRQLAGTPAATDGWVTLGVQVTWSSSSGHLWDQKERHFLRILHTRSSAWIFLIAVLSDFGILSGPPIKLLWCSSDYTSSTQLHPFILLLVCIIESCFFDVFITRFQDGLERRLSSLNPHFVVSVCCFASGRLPRNISMSQKWPLMGFPTSSITNLWGGRKGWWSIDFSSKLPHLSTKEHDS